MGFITQFIDNIVRIIKYLPVIWQDRDFDSHYFMVLMQFKLKRMADHLEEHNLHVGVEIEVAKIRELVELIDRVNNDEYREKQLEPLREMKRDIELFTPTSDGLYTMNNPYTPEVWEKIKEEMLLGEAERAADWRKIWVTIHDNLEGWWD